MREFKFRAFCEDKRGKFRPYYSDNRFHNIFWAAAYRGDFDTDVQQYTGIKDKNGKEIFEGDVVTQTNTPYLDRYVGVIEYINHLCAFKIVLNGKFGNEKAKIMQHMKADQDSMQDDSLQVIGNIYENPELIAVNENK